SSIGSLGRGGRAGVELVVEAVLELVARRHVRSLTCRDATEANDPRQTIELELACLNVDLLGVYAAAPEGRLDARAGPERAERRRVAAVATPPAARLEVDQRLGPSRAENHRRTAGARDDAALDVALEEDAGDGGRRERRDLARRALSVREVLELDPGDARED